MSQVTGVSPSVYQYSTPGEAPQKTEEASPAYLFDGRVLPGSPFEDVLKEIFQKLATSEEDAVKLRALSLESEQVWRKELLQKLGEEGMTAATKNRQKQMVSNVAHAVEPLPMIGAGLIALTASTGVGAAVLAGAGIIVGGLLILDAALGDPAKRALASALAKGDSEDTQTWMNRIFLVTGLTTLACSIGLTAGAGGAVSQTIQYIVNVGAAISETAKHGAEAVTSRRASTQNAIVLQLDESLRKSNSKLKGDLATIKNLHKSVKDLFDLFEASMKFHVEASSHIFAH